MSRTIITKSGTNFFTNVNSEELIGNLCKEAGARYENSGFVRDTYTLPYKVSAKEATTISLLLLTLIPKAAALFPKFKHFFAKGATKKQLINFIEATAKEFKDSKGYRTL